VLAPVSLVCTLIMLIECRRFLGANVDAAGCLPKHFSPLTNCEDVDRMSSLLRCEFGAASSEGRLP
jgi:hypothetical protein